MDDQSHQIMICYVNLTLSHAGVLINVAMRGGGGDSTRTMEITPGS